MSALVGELRRRYDDRKFRATFKTVEEAQAYIRSLPYRPQRALAANRLFMQEAEAEVYAGFTRLEIALISLTNE